MHKSSKIAHEQQSDDSDEDHGYDSDNSVEHKSKRKPAPIPRFIKNQIDQIDTDVIVLNISRTQYEVVEEVGKELGWMIQRSKKSQKWDIMWIDSHIEAHDLFKLNEHQKISHFPAIYVLTRKNYLGRSLMKMRNFFNDQYNFFPSTWSIPADLTELLRFDQKLVKNESNGPNFYIYKPQASAQGKGIKIYDKVEQLEGKNGIVQQYINNPFLIENLKFDLRIYVLILGYEPLRIFIYDEGLGRFATEKYQAVQKKNMKDVHMHLTNYAINKNNKNFIFNNSEKDMSKGHKRSLSAVYNYLQSRGIDVMLIKKKIDEIIIKTLLVGQPMIAHTYGLAQADTQNNELCFQILGFDVLINQDLQPILLQVNHTPSFKTDTPLDKHIKKNLIKDTLNLLNINTEKKKQKVDQKKQFIEMRSQRKLVKLSNQEKQELKKKKALQRDQYEMNHLGNFRKIFPVEGWSKYKQMIQISTKIFNQANGIKNKNININTMPSGLPHGNTAKLVASTRPKSLDRANGSTNASQVSPFLVSLKEKITIDGKYNRVQALRIKQTYIDKQKKQLLKQIDQQQKNKSQNLMISSRQKFPNINSPKRHQKQKLLEKIQQKQRERYRNYSGYMASNMKNQMLRSNIYERGPLTLSTGINQQMGGTTTHKLERTKSFNKNVSGAGSIYPHSHFMNSIIEPLESQLFSKGGFIIPKTLEMGQIANGPTVHKSVEMTGAGQSIGGHFNNNLSNNIKINTMKGFPSSASSHIPGQSQVPNSFVFNPSNSNIGMSKNGDSPSKSRNFEEVANEACLQISSFSPQRPTYQNLLSSLAASQQQKTKLNLKQQFIRLKPIRKL